VHEKKKGKEGPKVWKGKEERKEKQKNTKMEESERRKHEEKERRTEEKATIVKTKTFQYFLLWSLDLIVPTLTINHRKL
jgi:hypothetical protein